MFAPAWLRPIWGRHSFSLQSSALKNADSVDVMMLWIGDKLSNMRAIHRDQCTIGDALWLRFNEKRKEKHAWMYRQVAEALSELKDTFAWQEYDELVRKTFEE